MPEMLDHRQDLVFVDAALDHAVDLHGRQPGSLGVVDGGKHFRRRVADIVDRLEYVVVDGVQAQRHAVHAGGLEFAGAFFGEQRAVRGQADVVDAVDGSQTGDQHVDIAAQKRFAAGQAQLAHAQARGDTRQALDLVEVQQFAARQEQVFAAEQLPRHAVGAAEVAAVR